MGKTFENKKLKSLINMLSLIKQSKTEKVRLFEFDLFGFESLIML